jgi:hypothetical protein
LLGAGYDRPDGAAKGLFVGVVVIAWDENYDGIWITLEDMDECDGDGYTGTAIQRLRDDMRFVYAP